MIAEPSRACLEIRGTEPGWGGKRRGEKAKTCGENAIAKFGKQFPGRKDAPTAEERLFPVVSELRGHS